MVRRRSPALERMRASRARTRRLVWITTLVTAVGVGLLGVMFGYGLSTRPVDPVRVPVTSEPSAAAPRPAPTIVVRGGAVLLDGVEVATTDGIAEGGRLRRVDGLFDALERRRIDRDPLVPEGRTVVLEIAADVPVIVVRSVFQTAAFAGYGDVKLAVRDAGPP